MPWIFFSDFWLSGTLFDILESLHFVLFPYNKESPVLYKQIYTNNHILMNADPDRRHIYTVRFDIRWSKS